MKEQPKTPVPPPQKMIDDGASDYKSQIESIHRSHMMIEFDMDGAILKVNDNYLRAFGYTAAELAGKHHTDFVEATYATSPEYGQFWNDLRSGISQTGELLRIGKDGRQVWIEASYNPIFNSEGLCIGVLKFAVDVSERVKARASLKESEARLRAILDNVLDGIINIDAIGTILSVNPALVKMFGFEEEELLGQNIKILMPEPDRGDHDSHLAGYQSTGLSKTIGIGRELEGVTKSGQSFPMELTVTEVSLGGQRTFVGVIRDITQRRLAEDDRKRQETALRKSEELSSHTGTLAGVGGWEVDFETQEVTWSAELYRILGFETSYKPTLELGYKLYPPEAEPKIREAIERAMSEGVSWDLVLPLIRRNGSRFLARVIGSVKFIDGKPVRLVGAFQDVTVRHQEQQALKDANERMTLATNGAGIGIWDWDLKTNRSIWDAWMFRLYGSNQGPGLGPYEGWRDQLHPEDREAVEYGLRQAVEGKRPYNEEFRIIWADGSVHYIKATGQVTCDESGAPVSMIGTNLDVTERKLAESLSRQALAVAEEANRVKSDFLANMSHEVRTPLNAIIGMTHLALRTELAPKQQNYLSKISNAAQSLLRIMNDILDFSKMEAGKLQLEQIPFSLKQEFGSIFDIVEDAAKLKGIPIHVSISPEIPDELLGDPLRLGQVLINLVNNAVKFTDQGEIHIDVTQTEVIGTIRRLNFSITDTGIGMSQAQLDRLFYSFSQADSSITRRFGGTGLGLAISKQLCELMGGTISVDSTPGKGSTFNFMLDFDVSGLDFPVHSAEEFNNRKMKSVLVVDDSESTRASLANVLAENGFLATTVASGEEAISSLVHASHIGQPYHLVLMDWWLPGIDGMETSRRIKAHIQLSRIPAILMISAFERNEVMQGTLGLECEAFLSKPIVPSALIEAINSILWPKNVTPNPEIGIVSDTESFQFIGKHVLLVEDNEINRDLATELLSDLGIQVSIAVNGHDAVELLSSQEIDLVFMDIQMPIMDGLTATKIIRGDTRFRDLPILAMTAHAMSGDRERSLYAGMNDHLTKPISPGSLSQALLEWLPIKSRHRLKLDGPQPAAPLSYQPIADNFSPFNMQVALERLNGNRKLLFRIMLGFRNQYADVVSELDAFIAEGNISQAEKLIHSLKGAASALEASGLVKAATAIGMALHGKRTDSQVSAMRELERELKRATTAVTAFELAPGWLSLPESPIQAFPRRDLPRILVVDDDPSTFALLVDTFRDGYTIQFATDGQAALEIARSQSQDVILLDVVMPGMDGYNVCKQLKADPRTRDSAVIFISGLDAVSAETKGLELGAVDYITKPISPAAVKARVGLQIKLKSLQIDLTRLATTDGLTGLANRRSFDDRLAYEFARHSRSGSELSLILLDIDHFKRFNDSYGHIAGDDCLRQVAHSFSTSVVRATDLSARFGGEEFAFLLSETKPEGAMFIAERIRRSISNLGLPHNQSKVAKHVTVSLGVISAYPGTDLSVTSMLELADQQLYLAKSKGRNQVSGMALHPAG